MTPAHAAGIAAAHPDWLAPDWPAPPGVHALCTTREGGFSRTPYGSLNLGGTVGDDPVDVAANRKLVAQAIGVRPVFLSQVHATRCALLDENSPDGIEADACTTDRPGVACTIMIADCLPVLFARADGGRVGAAHAGWRGLASGVLETTVAAMDAEGPEGPASLMAWLGPCIGPTAFEVGSEVRDAFASRQPEAAACFKPAGPAGKWLADLQGLARQRLAASGVTRIYGNDGGKRWCTVNNPLRFFSHRRDRVSGRLAACIWRA